MKIHFLLVHGNWGDIWTWHYLSKELKALGHDFTLLRNPDRIINQAVPVPIKSTASYTDNVCEAADKIKAETGNYPVIIGHSLGAILAMQAATIGKARALVLAAPSLPSNAPQPLLSLANVRLFLPWLLGGLRHKTLVYPFKPTLGGTRCLLRGWPEESIKQVHENLQVDSGLILKEFALNSPATQADLSKIHCPAICIAGTLDEASPPKQVRKLAAAIRGEYLEIESHHFFMIEKVHGAPLIDKILKFLDRSLPQDEAPSTFRESA